MEKIKVGIVGLGRLGSSHCKNLLEKVYHAELVAACSIVPAELEFAREMNIKGIYDDFGKMLKEEKLNAVVLATSTHVHADQIIAALEAGCHVFCEKPLAIELADCQKVVDKAAQYSDKIVMIGFVRRFDKSYISAKKKIDEGLIGDVFKIHSLTSDWDEFAEFQVKFSQTSGGIFHDYNIHDIDLAHWLLGSRFKSVYSIGCSLAYPQFAEMGSADNTTCLAEMDNGGIATIAASRTEPHGHGTHTIVNGTKGTLAIGLVPAESRLEIYDQHGVRQECVKTFFERFDDAFLEELVCFIDAIRKGEPSPISLNESMEATRVAIAMTESFDKKKVVLIER